MPHASRAIFAASLTLPPSARGCANPMANLPPAAVGDHMKRRSPKTQAELRRANRGNVPGVLGMHEMAMLTGVRPHPYVGFSKRVDACSVCHQRASHSLHAVTVAPR